MTKSGEYALKTGAGSPLPPQPVLALNSEFQPRWDTERCSACETCIERCPMDALQMGAEDMPVVALERCIGCGVCATGCPEQAIELLARPDIPVPPLDRNALKKSMKKGASLQDGREKTL